MEKMGMHNGSEDGCSERDTYLPTLLNLIYNLQLTWPSVGYKQFFVHYISTDFPIVLSSYYFPVLGLLTPVTGITKLNPSIFSKVFLNLFSVLPGILESFLGSCQSSSYQHGLSNFSYTDIWIMLPVTFVILLKCLHFFCGPNWCTVML
jgi:hypothetical protein